MTQASNNETLHHELENLLPWAIKQAEVQHGYNKKWWVDLETGERKVRNKGEQIALIHSEISEAFNGLLYPDDKLPQYCGGLVEIVDALIRTFDFIGGWGYDLNKTGYETPYLGIVFAENEDKLAQIDELLLLSHLQTSNLLECLRKDQPEEKAINHLLLLIQCLVLTFQKIVAGIEQGSILDAPSGTKFAVATLDEVIEAKTKFNVERADHKLENRKSDGGKKF